MSASETPSGNPQAPICERHQTPMWLEPLGLANGTSLPMWMCAACDNDAEDDLTAFLERVVEGNFDD